MSLYQILAIFVLTIAGGILYRLGGQGHPFNTKHRDLGVPVVGLLGMLVLKFYVPFYIHLLAFGLFFASLTTYWDSVPFNKGKDNFWMHGFFCALAYLPYAIATGNWIGFGIRTLVSTVGIGAWSEFVTNDIQEEVGRGMILIATLPILLV